MNYNYNYPNYQMYQPQQSSYGFAFVNGIEDARTFIVNPNCTYFLRDRNSNLCFEKRADSNGRWTMEIYNLVKQDTNADFKNEISRLEDKVAELTALVTKAVGGSNE